MSRLEIYRMGGQGLRPQFRAYPTRHWQGGRRAHDGRWVGSWETAQNRWRTLTVEFIYWRIVLTLWRLA